MNNTNPAEFKKSNPVCPCPKFSYKYTFHLREVWIYRKLFGGYCLMVLTDFGRAIPMLYLSGGTLYSDLKLPEGGEASFYRHGTCSVGGSASGPACCTIPVVFCFLPPQPFHLIWLQECRPRFACAVFFVSGNRSTDQTDHLERSPDVISDRERGNTRTFYILQAVPMCQAIAKNKRTQIFIVPCLFFLLGTLSWDFKRTPKVLPLRKLIRTAIFEAFLTTICFNKRLNTNI